jgi:hypothetical protein
MAEILSSGNIMREILANSDITGIRKKIKQELTREQRGDFVEMGDAFEKMVNESGWIYLQAYMMKHIMGNMLSGENNELTKGFINIMHYIDQVIRAKTEIKAQEAEEREKV